MPIFIPVALIAIGVATGSGGLALGGKGAHEIAQAKRRLARTTKYYERRRAMTDRALAATNEKLAALGQQQQGALVEVVVRMGEFLRRHQRQVRESERLLVDGVDATLTQLPGLRGLDVDAVAWISGAIGSAAAGAGAGAGVSAAASSIGVASTGAAISGLSGAAAEGAALAFLGGGSLASGGGGIALGATALNFVSIGPALLVGGMVVKGQGTKALTRARELEAKVAVAVAELDATRTKLSGVEARAAELSNILERLTTQAVDALDLLETEPFEPSAHAARFQRAMTLVMAVRDVAVAPVIDADGNVTERSEEFKIRYRTLIEESKVA